LDDSGNGFWERLIGEWVGVLVLGFVVQGLWFGLVSLLTQVDPGLEPNLVRISAFLGIPWVLGIVVALVWGVGRARGRGAGSPGRR